jgi:hypothetical protein
MEHVRKRGLGEWMLGQALTTAWSTTPARVIVSTNTLDHPAALPLYQKMGFEPVSQNQAIIRPLADEEILALMKAGRFRNAGLKSGGGRRQSAARPRRILTNLARKP